MNPWAVRRRKLSRPPELPYVVSQLIRTGGSGEESHAIRCDGCKRPTWSLFTTPSCAPVGTSRSLEPFTNWGSVRFPFAADRSERQGQGGHRVSRGKT